MRPNFEVWGSMRTEQANDLRLSQLSLSVFCKGCQVYLLTYVIIMYMLGMTYHDHNILMKYKYGQLQSNKIKRLTQILVFCPPFT